MSDNDTIIVTLTTADFKLLMGEHEILKMRTEALVEAAREMLEFYDELIAEPHLGLRGAARPTVPARLLEPFK